MPKIEPYDPTVPRPLPESELARIERMVGFRLPDDYKAFMIRENGGEPEPSTFRYMNQAGPYTDGRVRYFYSIHAGKPSLERAITIYKTPKEHRRMPEEFVPIGADSFGNQICLCVAGPDYGSVWFWDHDNEGPEGAPVRDNLHLIGTSFSDFLERLGS